MAADAVHLNVIEDGLILTCRIKFDSAVGMSLYVAQKIDKYRIPKESPTRQN
jgi:hypothetical protein